MEHLVRDNVLFHTVLDAAVDAIILSDEQGIILRANAAANSLFGYAPDALIDESVNILMSGPMASRHDGFMQRHVETGESHIIGVGRDVEGLRKDGSIFPLHLSVGRAEAEGQLMFVAILHDLTQRAATEAALARSQRLDAIGQMTGGIAHDFNNLLTVIIGNLELLQSRVGDDKQAGLIKDALEAAELSADLTSRLMVFARRSNLKPVKGDLRKLCDDTLALLRRTLGAGIKISTDYAASISPVRVDPVQLRSALVNLVVNARHAMGEKGELLISISNVSIDDDYMAQEIDVALGNYVRLSVSDNGAGMSEAAQKRAFEPFFTTKTDRGGSGLGLSMVYGFVRQTGGHVTLYSELGLGTSFGLYFPAASDTEPDTSPPSARQTALHTPFGQARVVLVVEDNATVRDITVARIRDLGFEVEVAGSGDEAHAMLVSGLNADILVSDLVMPGALSGYDLAIRVTAEFPHLRVLLTSGYASDIIASRLPSGQPWDILHKPYRQSELVARLQALLADDAEG